jgi:hypothetical protein
VSATPRTDEAWAKRFDYHDISPWSLCMKLEIELNEADQKWERRLIAALGGHADSKLWGDDGLIAATWRCVEGYEKMEKELGEARMTIDDVCRVIAKEHEGPRLAAMRIVDELAEARDQLEGAGKLMGACDALVRQLAEAIKQRDELAEALLPLLAMTVAMLKNDTKTLHSEITITDKKTGNQTSMKAIEVIENADAAYRSLKGGSDE